jgi:hypothetical protein
LINFVNEGKREREEEEERKGRRGRNYDFKVGKYKGLRIDQGTGIKDILMFLLKFESKLMK